MILFQTKTWGRISIVGDEVDAVLAADLAPDGFCELVASAGPSRAVEDHRDAEG